MTATTFDFSQVRVMIVDDNRHMRALLFSILHAFGFKTVQEVSDGESALREIEPFGAEIVITDWHMEPMDGIKLVRNIRSSGVDAVKYVPIIMLTGHSEAERVREARDAGVHEFLAKPISASALYTRIVRIIESPRPFIKTEHYFGPDRRRQDTGRPDDLPERREKDRIDAADEASADSVADAVSAA